MSAGRLRLFERAIAGASVDSDTIVRVTGRPAPLAMSRESTTGASLAIVTSPAIVHFASRTRGDAQGAEHRTRWWPEKAAVDAAQYARSSSGDVHDRGDS